MSEPKSMYENRGLYVPVYHEAVIVQLQKVRKAKYVSESSDFAKLFAKLGRKYLGLMPEQAALDIMQEAFVKLFVEKLEPAFKRFSGSYLGETVTIEKYTSMLYSRELITLGKEATNDFMITKTVTPAEGESEADAVDRAHVSRKYRAKSPSDLEEAEHLALLLVEAEGRLEGIENGSILVPNYDFSVNKLKRDIAKFERQIVKLLGEDWEPTETNTDDGIFTVDEELDFCRLKLELMAWLKALKKYTLTHEAVFELSCDGFQQQEIAEYLSIDKNKVSKIMGDIKECTTEMAIHRAANNHDELIDTLIIFTKGGEDYKTVSTKRLESDGPKEVARQVYRLYGTNIAKVVG